MTHKAILDPHSSTVRARAAVNGWAPTTLAAVLPWLSLVVVSVLLMAGPANGADLRVMKTGLGNGTINGTGILCGSGGSDCNETGITVGASITLSVSVGADAVFTGWGAACRGVTVVPPATPNCTVTAGSVTSVRAHFDLVSPITRLADFSPTGIDTYLTANPNVDTPAEFVAALPQDFKENWILMPRSESLQAGTAKLPRILLVSADATRVFSLGLENFPSTSTIVSPPSYPGSHINAIEYMQWDASEKNFRFHEIILDSIPAMGDDIDPGPGVVRRFKARSRKIEVDDVKCFSCHSTRNVRHTGGTPGTTGLSPGSIKFKSKPNWDTYDSWGGMLPFNRDRIYKGSVEAAALRQVFNLWTWQDDAAVRAVIEQLELQPDGVPNGTTIAKQTGARDHRITRWQTSDGTDGHIQFGFDPAPPAVAKEPQPTGTGVNVTYSFDRLAGAASGGTSVARNSEFLTLHHSCQPTNDEGRGVELFDLLTAGLSRVSPSLALTDACPRVEVPAADQISPNALRIGDELISHRFATGSVPIDVRPIALAIAKRCISVSGGTNISSTQTVSDPTLAGLSFFSARNGLSFDQIYDDTRRRAQSLPRHKADIEKKTLDRNGDIYVYDPNPYDGLPPTAPNYISGLIEQYGNETLGVAGGSGGLDTSLRRLRQEVFRRPPTPGHPDDTVMGGIYADRENDSTVPGFPLRDNTAPVALFRYFLEPLGVSVDKWSMGVRGRSRTYTFADLFGSYQNGLVSILTDDLGLPNNNCSTIMPLVTTEVARLPAEDATPTYTDIQRVFNRSCIECHGGLGYPPYHSYGSQLDLSENETPASGERRLWRSMEHARSIVSTAICPPSTPVCAVGTGVVVTNSYLYQRITDNGLLEHPYNPAEPYNTANPDDATNPDVADERCPGGLMPCDGPPLSKTDIETFRRWIVGGRPNTEGDPHIKTVEGVYYDFQSAGEFVLLHDEDMELQVRQTPVTTAQPLAPNRYTGLSSCVSLNTAVAIRVGPHRVTYQPNIRSATIDGIENKINVEARDRRLILRIDGQPIKLGSAEIPLPAGGRIIPTSESDAIEVQYPGGTSIVITPSWWSRHQLWYMNIGVNHARAVRGVMGAIAPGNWLPALSDGSLLGPRPSDLQRRYDHLYSAFAASWQVTDTSSLFDYEPGLSAGSFVDEGWPFLEPASCSAPPLPGGPAPAPLPTPIAEADAAQLCRAIDQPERRENCTLDVMATAEPLFAETYLATQRLEQRLMPRTPVLVSPADNSLQPADQVEFVWSGTPRAEDPNVQYRHCLWNANQLYDFNNCLTLPVADRPFVGQATPKMIALCLALLVLVAALVWLLRFASVGYKWLCILLTVILLLVVGWCLYRLWQQPLVLDTSAAGLQANQTYYWKVVAENEEGIVVESPTRRFEVK